MCFLRFIALGGKRQVKCVTPTAGLFILIEEGLI